MQDASKHYESNSNPEPDDASQIDATRRQHAEQGFDSKHVTTPETLTYRRSFMNSSHTFSLHFIWNYMQPIPGHVR